VPTDAVDRLVFTGLAMVAEFEPDLIRLRTREGMKVAKAKGRLRGKPPKLNRRQEAHLVSLVHSGEYSTKSPSSSASAARRSTAPSSANASKPSPDSRGRHGSIDRSSRRRLS
jgi:DNA invertase Pin-like site-specific DNA recombinase